MDKRHQTPWPTTSTPWPTNINPLANNIKPLGQHQRQLLGQQQTPWITTTIPTPGIPCSTHTVFLTIISLLICIVPHNHSHVIVTQATMKSGAHVSSPVFQGLMTIALINEECTGQFPVLPIFA